MKLREYLDEGGGTPSIAFFISPKGELIDTKGSKHISLVTSYPDKFNVAEEEFDKNDKIVSFLIEQGWSRIKRYPGKFWIIDVPKIDDKKMKDRLHDWANKMLTGVNEFKEEDKNISVRLMENGKYKQEMTINDIAEDKLFEEEEMVMKRSRYILVEKEIQDV